MTADELNRRLAEALGWRAGGCYDREYIIAPSGAWLGIGHAELCTDEFDPARRVDLLRDYVLPEIERRGLKDAYMNAVWYHCKGEWYTLVWYMATADPAVLAEAALKVLEGER